MSINDAVHLCFVLHYCIHVRGVIKIAIISSSPPPLSRLEKVKEYSIPADILSASLHPDKHVFVCGGEDFKMYKFDYGTGLEVGKYGTGLRFINFLIEEQLNKISYGRKATGLLHKLYASFSV